VAMELVVVVLVAALAAAVALIWTMRFPSDPPSWCPTTATLNPKGGPLGPLLHSGHWTLAQNSLYIWSTNRMRPE
jgi:hypothetical protein